MLVPKVSVLERVDCTEISGPSCTFMICIVNSRVNDFKYVLFLFCFVFLLCLYIYFMRLVLIVQFHRWFFFLIIFELYGQLVLLQYVPCQPTFSSLKEGFYYSIVQVIKVILNFQWFWYKSHVCIRFIHVDFMQIDSFTVHSWRLTCFL